MGKLSERAKEQYEFKKENNFYKINPPFPKTMEVEVTNACNHACVFCSNPHSTRKRRLIETSMLLRIMKEARNLGTDELGLYTTGESLMHKELPLLIREAKAMGYRYVYISSNGALATPEKAKEIIDAGIDSIKFSINSGSRATYKATHKKDEFDLVINNLKNLSLNYLYEWVMRRQLQQNEEEISELTS